MPRVSLQARLKIKLMQHPAIAARFFALLGPRRLERIGQRNAIQAAQLAYEHVEYYRTLYEQHGFDGSRLRRLTWQEFVKLPVSNKQDMINVPYTTLLDTTIAAPAEDALIGRSSGTTGTPVFWPMSWEQFAIIRAYCQGLLLDVAGNRQTTAVLVMMAQDRGDSAAHALYRAFFSLKEQTHWPFEVFVTGEDPAVGLSLLHWLADQHYHSLLMLSFAGTTERLLDLTAEERQETPDKALDWSVFARKHIMLSGQIIQRQLRERVAREMQLDPMDLMSISVAFASSDIGQILAQSTPFTLWLEHYLHDHAALFEHLSIPDEHRGSPLLEFVPPTAVYIEADPDQGLLLTTWKHRPLLRYQSNDLVWMIAAAEVVCLLDREAPGWRDDFKRYGYESNIIAKTATLGIVLGRADDMRIVNSTNIWPQTLRDTLESAELMPYLHHFKHDTDDTRPNEYQVYLELREVLDEPVRQKLAEEWTPRLLDVLLVQPSAGDLATTHSANPIVLRLFVRSRGEDEFANDEQRGKKSYIVRRAKTLAPGAVRISADSADH